MENSPNQDLNQNNLDEDKIELIVRRLFSNDVEKHRNFLEKLFSQIKWAFTIFVIAFGVLIAYFSFDTQRNMKAEVNTLVEEFKIDEKVKERIDISIDRRATEASHEYDLKIDESVQKSLDYLIDSSANKIMNISSEKIQVVIDSIIQSNSSIDLDKIVETVMQRVTKSRLKSEIFPIGSIIPSTLSYREFYDFTEDRGFSGVNTAKTDWVPADGRSVVGSKYNSLISKNVPDLRGQFLRGLNRFATDELEPVDVSMKDPDRRIVGSYQPDAFQGHYHKSNGYTNTTGMGSVPKAGVSGDVNGISKFAEMPSSDGSNGNPRISDETRPKNVAVYYYIKIN